MAYKRKRTYTSRRTTKRRRTSSSYRRNRTALKSKYRPRRRRPYSKPKMSRPLFPNTPIVTHRWSSMSSLIPTTKSDGSYIKLQRFRANNIFDPDYTVDVNNSQHSAMGYNEMAAHYRKYIVLSSHITATIINTQTSLRIGYYGLKLHKYIKDNNDPLYADGRQFDPAVLFENNFKMKKLLMKDSANAAQSGTRNMTVSCGYKARKAYGKNYTNEPDFEMLNNEAETPTTLTPDTKKNYYYSLWCVPEPSWGTSGNPQLNIRVNITYRVLWFDKEILLRS